MCRYSICVQVCVFTVYVCMSLIKRVTILISALQVYHLVLTARLENLAVLLNLGLVRVRAVKILH